MKKYLLPLILILLLSFTLGGYSAWLAGWDYRIEISINDYAGDIGGSVTWFPATVFLKPDAYVYPMQDDDHVKTTTKYNTNYWAYFATDPAKSVTGSEALNSWLSVNGTNTNQRFHIDLGSAKIIKKIYYENYHESGATTNSGANNFTFWGSNTGAGSFDDLVYGNDGGWTEIDVSTNVMLEHTGADEADPQYITVTNSIAYRYYAFKFADNHGGSWLGVRRIELQSVAQANEVFIELTTDAEYLKMQFTEADGTSLLYGHKKLFDVSEELGIFTISADGWTINANTSVFLYYDKDHVDNNTYIGAINTSACEAVYNPQYKVVYDMADGADNAHIYDATDNNNDGTKVGANQPQEAAGKVGQGQDFAVQNDYITITNDGRTDFASQTYTIEGWFSADNLADTDYIFIWSYDFTSHANPYYAQHLRITLPDERVLFGWNNGTSDKSIGINGVVTSTDWYYVTATYTSGSQKLYLNGAEIGSATEAGTINYYEQEVWIGKSNFALSVNHLQDERRFSNVVRTPAWVKGTYNSGNDTLFTYGSEETEFPPVGITWNGIVITKWNGVTITIPINTQ